MLNIGLQFFAHKKGVGSTRNGRDSKAKRLGVKRSDGQFVLAGNTLYAKANGRVKFERLGKDRKQVSIVEEAAAE